MLGPACEVRCSYAKLTFFPLPQGAQDSIAGQDTGSSCFQIYDSHFKCNSTTLYYLISGFPTFRNNISSLLAVWLLKIHSKQIHYVQVLSPSLFKNGKGSEIFLIMKTNFICKYDTGLKLQKNIYIKENVEDMQEGREGGREDRRKEKSRKKKWYQDRQNDLTFP